MKTYNVKEIADMLNTNPETVRRWVRDKKLKAETVSRKDGTVISESELEKFLEASPKYARIASLGFGLSAPVGIPIAVAAMVGGAVLEHLDFKKNTELRAHSKEILKLLEAELENVKVKIQDTNDEIARQKKELKYLSRRSEELTNMIKCITSEIKDDKK